MAGGQFGGVYAGKTVLVTGHTGFKGSWLCLWLQTLGAKVVGYSNGVPTSPSHFELLNLQMDDRRGDIRNLAAFTKVLEDTQPDIVFHLAAQALVAASYDDPLETFSANVMGTATVLHACRNRASIKGIVNITSDKCYENTGKDGGYVETDPMGGHDPYSASKGCAELVAASYARAFADDLPPLASARAGNVVGGGDWAANRLIPDFVRALEADETVSIRSPQATRPWQHVLEPLSGYLLLGQHLLQGDGKALGGWNFGPDAAGTLTVAQIVDIVQPQLGFSVQMAPQQATFHEAHLLTLDSSKAHKTLSWQPVWNTPTMLAHTAAWYKAYLAGQPTPSAAQLAAYVADAKAQNAVWAE